MGVRQFSVYVAFWFHFLVLSWFAIFINHSIHMDNHPFATANLLWESESSQASLGILLGKFWKGELKVSER